MPTTIMSGGECVRSFELEVAPPGAVHGPLISCLMVSRGGRLPAAFAIECYRRQTYANRELVIVTTRRDSPLGVLVGELGDPTISYFEVNVPTLGELRNAAVAHSRGELICHWDDDDLSDSRRLSIQAAALAASDARASFLDRILLWWPARALLRISARRMWEGTMTAYRAVVPAYPALPREEDLYVSEAIARLHSVARSDLPLGYCYAIHGGNTNNAQHFEEMFEQSSPFPGGTGYPPACAEVAQTLPIADYAATLPIEGGWKVFDR